VADGGGELGTGLEALGLVGEHDAQRVGHALLGRHEVKEPAHPGA